MLRILVFAFSVNALVDLGLYQALDELSGQTDYFMNLKRELSDLVSNLHKRKQAVVPKQEPYVPLALPCFNRLLRIEDKNVSEEEFDKVFDAFREKARRTAHNIYIINSRISAYDPHSHTFHSH